MLDLNLKTTTFSGKVNFLANQDAQYAAVTIDETYVTADGNGIKKLLAGSFIGKVGTLFRPYVAATKAFLTTTGGNANSHLTFTAVSTVKATGEAIKVALIDPAGNDKVLGVTVVGDTVTVSLATSGAGAIISTAAEVAAAINAALVAKPLITAAKIAAETGAGVVAALAATALAGGVDAVGEAYAILAEDVDLTNYNVNTGASYSDKSAAAIVRGRVIEARLPVAPDAAVKAALTGILWA